MARKEEILKEAELCASANTQIAQHFFELGSNNAINKACEWLEETFKDGEVIAPLLLVQLIDKFRKAMKGE